LSDRHSKSIGVGARFQSVEKFPVNSLLLSGSAISNSLLFFGFCEIGGKVEDLVGLFAKFPVFFPVPGYWRKFGL
jgi:hypothetical protein